VTPIHRVANFAYTNTPIVGDRHLCVGDAIAFVDPIFSTGVFIAMRTGELAAAAVLEAFADGDFSARRFAAYERKVWRGVAPFFKFIHKYYEPAFLDLFLQPNNVFGAVTAVLNVLSGGSFIRTPLRIRVALALFFGVVRVNTWLRRLSGRPVESRLEW
jgi:flavin-dependent dehydrogenase